MLGERLARLEANRPARGVSPQFDMAGLAAEVVARVIQATEDGTFPRGLSDADLQALVALADAQGAK